MFSVIIPLYNKRGYVARTIRSVLAQSHADFELIVVDDGSTDDSVAVAEAALAGDPRARIVRQANAGVSAARNAGARAARHPWLAFLDADDQWVPHYLARVREVLDERPALRLVCCGFFPVAEGREPRVFDFGFGTTQRVVPDFDFYGIWGRVDALMAPSGTVVHRALYDAVGGYPEGVALGEDMMFAMAVVDSGAPRVYLNEALVGYSQEDTQASLSRSPSPAVVRSHERLLDALDAAVQDRRCPPAVLHRHLDIHFHHLLGTQELRRVRRHFAWRHASHWSAGQWLRLLLAEAGWLEHLRGVRR